MGLAALIDSLSEPALLVDDGGRPLAANRPARRLLGAEVLRPQSGPPLWDRLEGPDGLSGGALWDRLLRDGRLEASLPGGGAAGGTSRARLELFSDISDAAHVLLLHPMEDDGGAVSGEQLFRMFVEHASDIVFALDEKGIFHYVSPNWTEALGHEISQVLGCSFAEFVHPEDVTLCGEFLRRTLEGNTGSEFVEYRVRHEDGTWKWHSSKGAKLPEDGERMLFMGIARDVTQRKAAEQALRDSERRYRTIAENFPGGALFLCDRDLRYTFCDGQGLAEVGLSPETLIGRTIYEIYPQDVVEVTERHTLLALQGISTLYEVTYKGRLYESRIHPIINEDGSIDETIAIVQEVTERKRLEAQLRQAQKMEAIGRLAGGVAHDFNNQLTVINGYCEMELAGLDEDHPLVASLREIHKAGIRSQRLAAQLLAFSRRQSLQPEVCDLNEIVAGLERPLGKLLGEDIEIEFSPADSPATVHVDRAQTEQALMNLAINARDAMREGGQLRLEVRHVELSPHYAARHGEARAGRHVRLGVTDTGTGMDAETLQRVFEPFFTTKDVGEGTGLGLSMVYGFVKQSGGSVDVQSEPGRGTTVLMHLPWSEAPVREAAEKPAASTDAGGGETVFVVEDEQAVRELVVRVLSRQGYRVRDFDDPAEALKAAESGETSDLLIADVVMPRMRGPQLAERMRRLRPELKVLFVSGYTDAGPMGRPRPRLEAPLLSKPFRAEDLLRRVRDALGNRSADARSGSSEPGEESSSGR